MFRIYANSEILPIMQSVKKITQYGYYLQY